MIYQQVKNEVELLGGKLLITTDLICKNHHKVKKTAVRRERSGWTFKTPTAIY